MAIDGSDFLNGTGTLPLVTYLPTSVWGEDYDLIPFKEQLWACPEIITGHIPRLGFRSMIGCKLGRLLHLTSKVP